MLIQQGFLFLASLSPHKMGKKKLNPVTSHGNVDTFISPVSIFNTELNFNINYKVILIVQYTIYESTVGYSSDL